MKSEKLLKILGLTLSMVGAGVSVLCSIVSDKKQSIEIENLVEKVVDEKINLHS